MTDAAVQSLVGVRQCLYSKLTALRLLDACTTWMTSNTETSDVDLATVVGLLDDEHIRSILTATSETPLSATELGEKCGVSTSSIYRRLDRLTDAGLMSEQTRPRSDGHHDTVYVSRLDRFELTIRNGELDWGITRCSDDVSDQLTRMWGKF
ncbi:hypothetical protein GCM10009067_41940 [Haloarcula sebkhae]|uniref:Transcriptional regulator n=3 Tax=Haloarcula sebkhae TaxID=932660 RepID=A0A830ESI5_9EURY|nr:hypothetical protein GCM10009067_41940 [Haloarcula sebkhae]